MTRKYRSGEEIDFHREHHDPVTNWGRALEEDGILSETERKQIDSDALKEAKAAAAFAESSPAPGFSHITENVYWELDQPQRYSEGTLIFE